MWASYQLYYPFEYHVFFNLFMSFIILSIFLGQLLTKFHFQKRLVNYGFTIWIAKITSKYQLMTKHLKNLLKVSFTVSQLSRSPVLQNDCSDWGWWFSFSYLLIIVVSACMLTSKSRSCEMKNHTLHREDDYWNMTLCWQWTLDLGVLRLGKHLFLRPTSLKIFLSNKTVKKSKWRSL